MRGSSLEFRRVYRRALSVKGDGLVDSARKCRGSSRQVVGREKKRREKGQRLEPRFLVPP